MRLLRSLVPSSLVVLVLAVLSAAPASAQEPPAEPPPGSQVIITPVPSPDEGAAPGTQAAPPAQPRRSQQQAGPQGNTPPQPSSSGFSPPPSSTEPAANNNQPSMQPESMPGIETQAPPPGVAGAEQPGNPALLDGHVREGAFLAGPGSLTFVLHHTIMGAAAGFVTQGISTNFAFSDLATRERVLAGTLIGAGLGFGGSAWYQFYNWIGTPMASYGIVNSVLAGVLLVGITNLFTTNGEALAWTAFLGTETGAWLTALLAGGDMPVSKGLLIASGGLWGLVYSALVYGMLGESRPTDPRSVVSTLFIPTGLGGVAMAIAAAKYNPSSAQILRADIFGLGVGAAVFVISSLVVGLNFNLATPYVLTGISAAGAIAAVSLLWAESAETPAEKAVGGSARYFYRSKELDRPYRTVWW